MLSCDLIALPDELLLSCVDKSLRTCVMLAGTSKAIRAKLSYQAKARSRAAATDHCVADVCSFSPWFYYATSRRCLEKSFLFRTTGITDRNVT